MVDTRSPRPRVPAPEVETRRNRSGSPTPLTARGGVVVIFAITAAGTLLGWLSGIGWVPGAAFVVGCLLAAVSVRPPDLIGLVVSPPLTFLTVILVGEIIAGWGRQKGTAGLFLRLITDLVAVTPWLFAGTLLVLCVAMARGLPASVRELGARLAAERENEHGDEREDVQKPEAPAGREGRPARSRAGPRLRRARRSDPIDDDPVRWDEDPPL
jgi:hypothetical protein